MCVGVRCTVFGNASFTKGVLGKQLVDPQICKKVQIFKEEGNS